MSREERGSFVRATANLQKAIDGGVLQPSPLPKMLALKEIRRIEDVFQHREHHAFRSAQHITGLKQGLQSGSGTLLPPVTVFWVGDGYACVDGHHRLDAYEQAGHRGKIPVKVFAGTLAKATLLATGGNSKDKLAMTTEEKMDAAWRYVCCGKDAYSKAEIANAASVSERQVGYMRFIWRQATEDGQEELDQQSWRNVRRDSDGKDRKAFDEDKAAQDMALRMAKAFPESRLTRDPEVFIKALKIYDPETEWSCRSVDETGDSEGDDF